MNLDKIFTMEENLKLNYDLNNIKSFKFWALQKTWLPKKTQQFWKKQLS